MPATRTLEQPLVEIPSLFILDENGRATPQLNPECEWVKTAAPVVSRLRDGVPLLAEDGKYYLFKEIKKGQKIYGARPVPPYRTTGNQPAWCPLRITKDPDRVILTHMKGRRRLPNGTYEAFGPGINGNHEGVDEITFLKYGAEKINGIDVTFSMLRIQLHRMPVKGFMLQHPNKPDIRAKVLRTEFGEEWPPAYRMASVGT